MPETSLAGKLLTIAKSIANIEKRGRNTHQNYDYVQASDVVRDVRKLLHKHKVIVLPGASNVQHAPAIGGRGMVTTVDLAYTFVDTESGETLVLPWIGAGSDVGGDKGLYKAYTGGLKYMLLAAFLIPTGDDPEADATSVVHDSKAADADRPAATRIPLDRAKSIAEAAVAAGLATMTDEDGFQPSAVFKAKLETLGVAKVGVLDVDQAEDVEAFIASESA